MASGSSEGNVALKRLTSRLGVMLNADGEKERKAWRQVRQKLAEFATLVSVADPKTIEGVVSKTTFNFNYPEAQAIFRQIMETILGEVDYSSSKSILVIKDFIAMVATELNMAPLRDSGHRPLIEVIQVKDTNLKEEIIFSEDDVNYMLSNFVISQNAPYGVVSIVGAQSSGKSTLLNELFGTDFEVLDKTKGWKQTTRGIVMSKCIGPSLLILDVEGFDGREKGEEKGFENKAALFALTVSDLMMVNISEQDTGRNQGGGQPLFKTIFQERTKLPPSLTRIVVVIRRCDMQTSVEILTEDVIANMKEMWKSVHAKSKEAAAKFEDYIEVTVVALPEIYMPDFHTKVTELRKLIANSTLGHDYRSAKVPASSFPLSSKQLWDDIMQNRTLDLPSHKVAIATIYCQNIAKDALNSFVSQKESFEMENSPWGFKVKADTLLENSLATYDQETIMYDEDVRTQERKNMANKIKEYLAKYSLKVLQEMRNNMSKQFKNEMGTKMQNMEDTGSENEIIETVELCIKEFNSKCNVLKQFDMESFQNICTELQKELYLHTTYQILEIKEKRGRKDIQSALEKSDKNIDELMKRLEETTNDKKHVLEEVNRQKERQENQYKEQVEQLAQIIKTQQQHQKERLEAEAKLKTERNELLKAMLPACAIL